MGFTDENLCNYDPFGEEGDLPETMDPDEWEERAELRNARPYV
jgi:hypothetical protein